MNLKMKALAFLLVTFCFDANAYKVKNLCKTLNKSKTDAYATQLLKTSMNHIFCNKSTENLGHSYIIEKQFNSGIKTKSDFLSVLLELLRHYRITTTTIIHDVGQSNYVLLEVFFKLIRIYCFLLLGQNEKIITKVFWKTGITVGYNFNARKSTSARVANIILGNVSSVVKVTMFF